MKIIKKSLISLFIVLIIGSLFITLFIYQKTPNRNQTLTMDGLSAPVEVLYDNYGVPHIYASNDEDMYRAFGYIHAQDRLFQMDLLRRLGQGRLSELFGKDVIKIDQLFKTIQIGDFTDRWVKNYYKSAPKKILKAMDAYLAGVNQYVRDGKTPVEFNILGVDKSEFTAEDIASVLGFTAYSFTFGMTQDLMVSQLLESLSDEHIEDLGIRWQKGSTRIPVNRKGLELLNKELSAIIEKISPTGIFQGSNGWVIAPERTKSGKAMLVNDPHMAFSQPSVWYEAHLVSPESEIYGHHLALVPFALLGNNYDIAWGLTMFVNDDIDLFKEKVNPENPNQYWAIDHWQDFETKNEIIHVKNAEDVTLKLRSSRHGPIVSSAFSAFEGTNDPFSENSDTLSMWWTFFQGDNDMITALYELSRAKNVTMAASAVKKIASPGLNVMYADKHGDIAWWAAAQLVKRPPHVNSSVILDGSTGLDDPLGFYDFSENPQILNPESGSLFSANNQPEDTGIGLIPGYYVSRDRAQKIQSYLLTDENKWDRKKMKTMLLDNNPPFADYFQSVTVDILISLKVVNETKLSKLAFDVYSKWDGKHTPTSSAPTIYYNFKKQILRHTFKDEMGENNYKIFETGFLRHKTLWKMLNKVGSPWWDDVKTSQVETRKDIIQQSWNAALSHLQSQFGDDIEAWQWQYAAKILHPHPLGKVKLLDKLFNVGPFVSPSGNLAINNLKFDISKDQFTALWGPSTRRIIDFGDMDHNLGINPTGQSGVLFDEHYGDQAAMHARGEFRRQYMNRQDVVNHLGGRIIFNP